MADEIRSLKGEVQQLLELIQRLPSMIQEQRGESKARATKGKKIDSQTRKIELFHSIAERGVSKPSYSEISQGLNARHPAPKA